MFKRSYRLQTTPLPMRTLFELELIDSRYAIPAGHLVAQASQSLDILTLVTWAAFLFSGLFFEPAMEISSFRADAVPYTHICYGLEGVMSREDSCPWYPIPSMCLPYPSLTSCILLYAGTYMRSK